MTSATRQFVFHYPPDFDAQSEFEMPSKGYLAGGEVELNGSRYPVTIYDPVRLKQELELAAEGGVAVICEPALVVVPEVTPAAIASAVEELVRQRYFDHLKPIAAPVANGVLH